MDGANYTPKQRAARIAAMRAGHARRRRANAGKKRGVSKRAAAPRKAVVKRAPKVAHPKASGAWASMSLEQRAERVAKMRAGRAKAVDATPAAPPTA